jgi:hypothetical protein
MTNEIRISLEISIESIRMELLREKETNDAGDIIR